MGIILSWTFAGHGHQPLFLLLRWATNRLCRHPLIELRKAFLTSQYNFKLHTDLKKKRRHLWVSLTLTEFFLKAQLSLDTVRVHCGVRWSSPWVASLRQRLDTSSSFQTLSYQHSLPLDRTCAGSLRMREADTTLLGLWETMLAT